MRHLPPNAKGSHDRHPRSQDHNLNGKGNGKEGRC